MPFGLDLQVGSSYGSGTVVMHEGVKMLEVPLSGRLYYIGRGALYRDGAGLGLSGSGQCRPYLGDGRHQFAGDAVSVRFDRRLFARRRAVACALGSLVVVDHYLCRVAVVRRLLFPEMDHQA